LSDVEVRVAADPEEAARWAARELAEAARRGGHVALSGGSGPRLAYRLAARLEPDWGRVELWWGDDRCVPPGDPLSNYRLVRETLLDGLARPPRMHRIHGELEPDEAARRYDEELRAVALDAAFQGLGPDGHTASLFPNAPALEERKRAAVVVAKPGMEPLVPRVTMTIPTLVAAPLVLFLVTGEAKAEAAARAFAGEPGPQTPASLVRSGTGRTSAILDRAAASRLQT
jgi:6-phosphogluconolactonase